MTNDATTNGTNDMTNDPALLVPDATMIGADDVRPGLLVHTRIGETVVIALPTTTTVDTFVTELADVVIRAYDADDVDLLPDLMDTVHAIASRLSDATRNDRTDFLLAFEVCPIHGVHLDICADDSEPACRDFYTEGGAQS